MDQRPVALAQARHRRFTALLAAGLLAGLVPIDAGARYPFVASEVRLAWIAAILLFGAAPPKGGKTAACLLALLSAVALSLIVWTTGARDSMYFGFLYALPFAVLVLFPDGTAAACVAGIATLLSGVVILVASGEPGRLVIPYVATSAAAGVFAMYGSLGYRSVRDAELRAERERRCAVEDLAESERRRARAERLAIIGQLAAGVAHEVNNPLSYVKSNVGWMRRAVDSGALSPTDVAEARQAMRDAEAGLARIQAIVADLRSFARPDDGATERCDAAEAIDEAIRLASMRVAQVATIAREVPPGAHPVRLAHSRLVQIVVNLLVNAADAIESERRADGRIRLQLAATDAGVAIEVADDGPGIPDHLQARLFEPFFTTKGAKGTGLGLALSREYVERCGGTIEARPRSDRGAAFRVTLRPARGAAAAAA